MITPTIYKQDYKDNNRVTTSTSLIKDEIQSKLEQLEVKELEYLKLLKKHKEDCPIEYFTRPNPPQEKLLNSWDNNLYKVFVFSGGNRVGKTTIGSIIAVSNLVGYWPWSGKMIEYRHTMPRKIRYVGQDWEKHIGQVVIPALKKWYPHNRPVYIKKNVIGIEAYWRDEKTGSTLEVMSNKQDSDLHEGWDGDLVVYDEPPRREIRVANARGLVDRNGRELFCMTLLKEGWIDREVIKAVDEDGNADRSIFTVHGETYANVGYGITEEGIKQFEKTLTSEEKEARLRGIPSYLSGLIYGKFSRQTHILERFKIDKDAIIDIAIDVHPREKQAVLFVATQSDGNKYLIHEIWEHGAPEDIAKSIIDIIRNNEYIVGQIIIDPFSKGDKNNNNTIYDRFLDIFTSYGYTMKVASKDKSAGILLVKEHIMSLNNIPSLFVFNDLKRTIYEFDGYMWDEDTQKPQDKDDHMMENLYRLMLLDTQWTPYIENNSYDNYKGEGANYITGY